MMSQSSGHTRIALTGLLIAASLLAPKFSFAAFPERPIKLVVPFAPGGGTDTVARSLGQQMSKALKTPVVIDNKPGASTIIGSETVARSAPDGYTLVVATLAHAVNPSMQPKMPFDTEKAFTAVTLIGSSHNVLVVKPSSPYKTVQDIIDAAKANPGKLSFASQGSGTSAHLAGEMFQNLTGVTLNHIPYKGAGPALTDLLGGQVDMMFATQAAVTGFIDAKRLRPIAVTAPIGQSKVEGAPTIADTVPGYVVDSWYALYAPAGTPADVIKVLVDGVKTATQDPDFVKRAQAEGITIRANGPQDLDSFVKADMQRWRKIVIENKIQPE